MCIRDSPNPNQVLAVAHSPHKFVYHAVHMTFSGGFEEAWAEVSKQVLERTEAPSIANSVACESSVV